MKRIMRSTQDKKVAGVCGGLGVYFGIDPVIFRIIFVISALCGGFGLLMYVLLWLLAPEDSQSKF
ncbi:MAG: PspC domain-containing protein [Sedimentisphaerales bacterium]|nr:PspC domain-containing protein [Sedimentisphaerales bacterium]